MFLNRTDKLNLAEACLRKVKDQDCLHCNSRSLAISALRVLDPPPQRDGIERVSERLRAECLEIFGSAWNRDVAERLARAAVDAMQIEPRP